jgi:hypothetical protein
VNNSDKLFFEGRELKDHAEPISANELKENTAYFSITYTDENMLFPIIQTLYFIGFNLHKGDTKQVYFQDPNSYHAGINYESAIESNDATFFTCTTEGLGAIFNYEHALEQLMLCSLRRKKYADKIYC